MKYLVCSFAPECRHAGITAQPADAEATLRVLNDLTGISSEACRVLIQHAPSSITVSGYRITVDRIEA